MIVVKDDFRQRDWERISRELHNRNITPELTIAEYYGGTLRAGIAAGIVTGIQESEVDDMKPAEMLKYAKQINKLLAEALQDDPLSLSDAPIMPVAEDPPQMN